MLDKVSGDRVAADSHPYLIKMWKALQDGWIPPREVSEAYYQAIKANPESYPPELVCFVGFLCSFGAKWWGGYARGKTNKGQPRNYAEEAYKHLLKQKESLEGVVFIESSYQKLDEYLIPNSLIYCDPPYVNTTKYKGGFDHDEFWNWVRDKSLEHTVFVSEYSAPDDFECLLEVEHNTSLDVVNHYSRMERLFQYVG